MPLHGKLPLNTTIPNADYRGLNFSCAAGAIGNKLKPNASSSEAVRWEPSSDSATRDPQFPTIAGTIVFTLGAYSDQPTSTTILPQTRSLPGTCCLC